MAERMRGGRDWLGLAGWLAAAGLAGVAGNLWGSPGAWYAALDKPAFNPPSWVFGPVWTVLYATMGIAAWLVWREREHPGRWGALALFLGHLVLNAAWSWIFFGMQRPDLAFFQILVLWAAIVAVIAAFWRIRPLAGRILLPYLAWVSFAAFLNYTLWRMNPGA
jgi:translocator protein